MKVDNNFLKIDVAENKRNDRGGFNRGRGGNMGGGFQRRDGPPNRGYNDDFNNSMFPSKTFQNAKICECLL